MDSFTLTRAAIRASTGWRYSRVRTLIEKPYRLDGHRDPAGPKGGGRVERFRLSDVLARCRTKQTYDDEAMTSKLIAADAAYRNRTKQ